MKILLISNGYPPHRWAGTETYTAGIAEGLKARGHEIQVICAGEWEKGERYWNGYTDDLHNGIAIRRIHLNWTKAPDPNGYLYNNPVVSDYLKSFLEQVKPDLVHITSCETLSASIIKTIKTAGLPLVLSLTDFWFLCPRISLLRSDGVNCDGLTTPWDCLRCQLLDAKVYRWPRRFMNEQDVSKLLLTVSNYPLLTRQPGLRGMASNTKDRKTFLNEAIRLADYRITASPFVRDIFIRNDGSPPIQIQPYGHNLSWLDHYSGKKPSEFLRIAYVGQIIESKGIHLLLQAAQSLPANSKNKIQLKIYGNLKSNVDYANHLLALASKLDNVEFCGTYPHEQSGDVFANLDVLVVPSLWYDFPLVIYEAFATRSAVIATGLGGMSEVVNHEVNGLLFERGDAEDLSRQILRIIDEPALYKQLQNGIPAVKSIEEEVFELENIYQALISSREKSF